MNPPIEFASGHKCIDNRVGDYDLICPTLNGKVCFLPYMIARTLGPHDCCPYCQLPVGQTNS